MTNTRPKLVIVKTPDVETIGYFFFETNTHVVLINNFSPGTINLGPIEDVATEWIEPEVSIFVIPMSEVEEIAEIRAN